MKQYMDIGLGECDLKYQLEEEKMKYREFGFGEGDIYDLIEQEDMIRQRKRNILAKTKTYLIGPMQYAEGRSWREDISDFLRRINVTIFDPYKKPFINAPDEDEETHNKLLRLMDYGNELCDEDGSGFDAVARHMKQVRSFDLSMVDRADFIICYLDPKVPTFGTLEELSWACRCKKPTFIVVEGGKKKTPFWVMGMFPHKYIYNSFDEIQDVIQDIHDGKKYISSDRWRLFEPHLR